MAQVTHSPKVYDVCIIGSGAAGGTAAKVLTEGGSSVVMLEAGPPIHPAALMDVIRDYPQFHSCRSRIQPIHS